MLNKRKYSKLYIIVIMPLVIISSARTQEKPLPPLIEMMTSARLKTDIKPILQTSRNDSSIRRKGLPPLGDITSAASRLKSGRPADSSTRPSSAEGHADEMNAPAIPSKRKLPTLREELQSVESRQKEQHTINEELRKEISEVKSKVEQLQNNLGTAAEVKKKTSLKSQPADKQPTVNSAKREEAAHYDENIIIPDGGGKTLKKPNDEKVKTQPTGSASGAAKQKAEAPPDYKHIAGNAEQSAAETSAYHLAMNLISRKKYGDAIPLLQQTLQSEKSQEKQSSCYYWLGESNYGVGKYDEAIKYFQKVNVLRTSDKLDDAQLMIAESYYRKGDLQAAKAAFQRLVDVYPRSVYVARAKRMLQQL